MSHSVPKVTVRLQRLSNPACLCYKHGNQDTWVKWLAEDRGSPRHSWGQKSLTFSHLLHLLYASFLKVWSTAPQGSLWHFQGFHEVQSTFIIIWWFPPFLPCGHLHWRSKSNGTKVGTKLSSLHHTCSKNQMPVSLKNFDKAAKIINLRKYLTLIEIVCVIKWGEVQYFYCIPEYGGYLQKFLARELREWN